MEPSQQYPNSASDSASDSESDSGADVASSSVGHAAVSLPSSRDGTDGEEETSNVPIVGLQVRVAEAQGLRLHRGGEIRLVLTLRASDDLEGENFGAKVTPWLSVPENQAPQWKARSALFSIRGDRCFHAGFVESVYLHIALYQRGHVLPQDKTQVTAQPTVAPTSLRGLGVGLMGLRTKAAAALEGASTNINALGGLIGGALGNQDRGELVGVLTLPVGKLLVSSTNSTAAVQGEEGGEWVQLFECVDTGMDARVKGALLLETCSAITVPVNAPQQDAAASTPALLSPRPIENTGPQSPAHTPKRSDNSSEAAASDVADKASEKADEETRSVHSGFEASQDRAVTEESADGIGETSAAQSAHQTDDEQFPLQQPLPDVETSSQPREASLPGFSPAPPGEALLDFTPRPRQRQAPSQWKQPARRDKQESFDAQSKMNIFVANDTVADGSSFKKLLKKLSEKSAKIKPLKEQLRNVIDPSARKKKKEARKWRRWHEIFVALNEIERRLKQVVDLLLQAASSMKQFEQSHSTLEGCEGVSAFLRDAGLYFRSEAEVPRRLEKQLTDLERAADFFRALSLEAKDPSLRGDEVILDEEQLEQQRICEDLQVDVAVLLESALMASQQALAEYKTMHCRLELLATEYDSVCRMEMEDDECDHAFLPLLAESPAEAAAATMPEQAMQWAVDFSEMIGSASKHLDGLVKELDHRRRHLKNCSAELRDYMMRRVCGGGELGAAVLA